MVAAVRAIHTVPAARRTADTAACQAGASPAAYSTGMATGAVGGRKPSTR
jgi:hypothetical protein